MRLLLVVLALLGFGPSAWALDAEAARHLLTRAGIGANPHEIAALGALDQAAAVRRLLDGARTTPVTPPPSFLAHPRPDWRAFHASEDSAFHARFLAPRRVEFAELRAWWVREMLDTPSPFTERMVLFWHNHFATSMDKVQAPDLLYRQNLTLRRLALGDFRELLLAMTRDPAMLVSLDGVQNRRDGANENYAREFFELFTLGPGHYSETDIREAARAFSGWSVDWITGEARFEAPLHDPGRKFVLGMSGPWSDWEVVYITLANPQVAEHIVGRMWREFVSDTPEPAEIRRIAAIFRRDYSIRAAMEAILTSPAFVDAATRGSMIKSPVDLLIGTARSLVLPVADTYGVAEDLATLRQDLFNPPNVRGWIGGTNWITTLTLVDRREALRRLIMGERARLPGPPRSYERDPPPLAAFFRAYPGLTTDRRRLARLLLADEPVETSTATELRSWVMDLLSDPQFQMR